MAEIRVSVTYHFMMNPENEIIGDLTHPPKVQRTIAVGDKIGAAKVDFNSGFDGEVFEKMDTMLNAEVAEYLRTAKPVSESKAPTAVSNDSDNNIGGCCDPSGDVEADAEEDGMSAF